MNKQIGTIIFTCCLTLLGTLSAVGQQPQKQNVHIASMQAKLFYQDKGTFSEDVSVPNSGPPYVPPSHWNTPMQYENRSTSVFVSVEVTGNAGDEKQLEFTARYIPWQRETRPIVITKRLSAHLPVKVGESDSYHAGFWLYDTGCNPVFLTARIVGSKSPVIKRVIKFGCGE